MPRLRQFHFHIRSILHNASRIKIHRRFHKQQQQAFGCIHDHFKNNFGQYQIYSLPSIGTRLDFISNRFPLFDNNNTFSNVKPFESIFFDRLARALPQLNVKHYDEEKKENDQSV